MLSQIGRARRRARALLIAGAAALVAVVALAAAASPTLAAASTTPGVPAGFVGMNVGAPVFPVPVAGVNPLTQAKHMESVGVETVRTVFDWSAAQPYAKWSDVPSDERSEFVNVDGVPTDFAQTDLAVADAAAEGMSVLPTVLYAPSWDATGGTSADFARPARTAPYAAYLTALVDRYGPRGTFWKGKPHKVPITEWQIWNEPDLVQYWTTQPFATTYVALLHAAHVAIKRADPSALVVTAGLTNFSWDDLASMYKVKGARGDFDVVALNPYTKNPAGVPEIIGFSRKVMDENHDAAKSIIASEVSWTSAGSSHGSGADVGTTQQGQARNLSALLPLLARDRQSLGLRAFYWFTWATPDTGTYTFEYAGLSRYTGDALTAKPALGAFRTAALAIEHCRAKGPLATDCTTG